MSKDKNLGCLPALAVLGAFCGIYGLVVKFEPDPDKQCRNLAIGSQLGLNEKPICSMNNSIRPKNPLPNNQHPGVCLRLAEGGDGRTSLIEAGFDLSGLKTIEAQREFILRVAEQERAACAKQSLATVVPVSTVRLPERQPSPTLTPKMMELDLRNPPTPPAPARPTSTPRKK